MRYLYTLTLVMISALSIAEWADPVPVGNAFPKIDAIDQHGKHWTNNELVGEHGLVFFFNRSTTW